MCPREISSVTPQEIEQALEDRKKREELAKTCQHKNKDSETYEDFDICVDCRTLIKK